MDNHIIITRIRGEQSPVKVELKRLTAEDAQGRKEVGRATGADFHHCLYLVSKSQAGFLDTVRYYRLVDKVEAAVGQKIMGGLSVAFYE